MPILVALLMILGTGAASAANIKASDMRGLRQLDDGFVIPLDFSAIKSATQDRTVVHFDISSLWGDVSGSTLNIGIINLDPDLPAGTLDVYVFAGDGAVSIDEWNIGSLFHSFSGIDGELIMLTVDISALLLKAISSGDKYLSFNLSTLDSDRYFLNSTIDDVTTTFGPGITFPTREEGPTFINLPNAILSRTLAIFSLGVVSLGLVGIVLTRRRKKV